MLPPTSRVIVRPKQLTGYLIAPDGRRELRESVIQWLQERATMRLLCAAPVASWALGLSFVTGADLDQTYPSSVSFQRKLFLEIFPQSLTRFSRGGRSEEPVASRGLLRRYQLRAKLHLRGFVSQPRGARPKGGRFMISRHVRGIDHIGLTVPDIAEAERFLIEGLGAEFIYETLGRHDPPFAGPEVERAIALPSGATVDVIRMYKLGVGPGIELFQYTAAEQRPAARACDIGWQHISVYVDDMEASTKRCVTAGAELLSLPWDLTRAESGDGNRFCFIRAPFGALIELITFPAPQRYEADTALRRWKPPTGE